MNMLCVPWMSRALPRLSEALSYKNYSIIIFLKFCLLESSEIIEYQAYRKNSYSTQLYSTFKELVYRLWGEKSVVNERRLQMFFLSLLLLL